MRVKFIPLIFLILIISCNEKKDIKLEQFVTDVENIEYLTLNICINESGKTENIEIVSEKTSYKNQSRIKEIIEINENIIYPESYNLNGNCKEITYRFVNEKYRNKVLTDNECLNFEKFKIGKFKYGKNLYPNTIITRTENTQIEKSNSSEFTYYVKWKSPCKYSLTYKTVSEKRFEYLIGETINVQILDVLKNGDYVYKSNLLNRTIVTGIMTKL